MTLSGARHRDQSTLDCLPLAFALRPRWTMVGWWRHSLKIVTVHFAQMPVQELAVARDFHNFTRSDRGKRVLEKGTLPDRTCRRGFLLLVLRAHKNGGRASSGRSRRCPAEASGGQGIAPVGRQCWAGRRGDGRDRADLQGGLFICQCPHATAC